MSLGLWLWLVATVARPCHVAAWAPTGRREMLLRSGLLGSSAWIALGQAVDAASSSADRLTQDILVQPPTSSRAVLSTPTTYPDFLEGTWDVTQTLVGCKAPLGLRFAGGPNGVESIGVTSIKESESQLNKPVKLQLRYMRNSDGQVVEDRVFNTRQRLDNFAGRPVVSTVDMTADTGTLQNSAVLVRFRGPAAQKTFVTAHHTNTDNTSSPWSGWERQRSLFALTNESTAPPITTDSELIYQFEKQDANRIVGKFRIAGYLNPIDRLYFDAGNKAVTLQDYSLDLQRSSS